jgi:hypothetical protein
VRVVRVRATGADFELPCEPGRAVWLFVERSHRERVEAFCPTVITSTAGASSVLVQGSMWFDAVIHTLAGTVVHFEEQT